MARVFISHSSRDVEPAELLLAWLLADGHEVFLDRDLRDGIAVGEEWEQRLHERLRWADAVVCVLSPAYLASVWCAAEVGIARSRGCRLLPVRVARDVSHPLLKNIQQVDLTTDRGVARGKLVEALRRVDSAGGMGWPDARTPYPGLRPFDTDQRQVFFGRTTEIEQLVGLLRSPAERAEGALLLVVGPSGCGKSSLVRAGLLPTVAEEPDWWVLPAFVPGSDPVAALIRELAAAARHLGMDWTLAGVRRQLEMVGLAELAGELLLRAGGRARRLLVTVDQFEELLTQTGSEQRARFGALLDAAIGRPVQVVATLRPEFLEQALASPELAALSTRTYSLRPLTSEALNAVIEKPARLAGIEIPEDLVTRLVADTDGGEALPLLAYTLAQLAEGVPRGGRLLVSRYEQLGGVAGALARQADLALVEATAVAGRGWQQIIRELLELVTVDEQGRPTRRRVDRNDLDRTVAAELDAFVARRLLTTDGDNGAVVVSVAHEAFLRAWPPLAAAIAAASTGLRARRGIEHAAAAWVESKRPTKRLWDGGQLAAALADVGGRVEAASRRSAAADRPADRPAARRKRWWPRRRRVLVTDRVQLSRTGREFLLASLHRDRLRRGRSTAVLSVLLVLALIAAGVAFVERNNAQDQQRLATARQHLAQADRHRDGDPRLALQLGFAAYVLNPSAETLSGLVSTIATIRFAHDLVHDHPMRAVVIAPDGRTLASAGYAEGIQLWDMGDRQKPRRLGSPIPVPGAPVLGMAFAGEGRVLATANYDGTVGLWDISDRAQPRPLGEPLTGHTDIVNSVAFAPNGHTLASASNDRTVLLWDVSDPGQPRRLGEPLEGHTESVSAVGFAPDGRSLASVSFDKSAVLWDVTDPAQPRRLGEPLLQDDTQVYGVAFAPDGRVMVTTGGNRSVSLWDVSDRARPRRLGPALVGHTGWVNVGAFSADGRILATGGSDGRVLLWDVTDPANARPLGGPLTGHRNEVHALAFLPGGQAVASASEDGSVLLWQVTDSNGEPRHVLTGHTSSINEAALAPDGRTLATAGDDRTVILWDLSAATGPQRIGEPLTGHQARVRSVAFAADGRVLASAGDDRTILLWDLTEPGLPRRLGGPLVGHSTEVFALAVAPDGRTLASGGADSTARLWDLTDPARPEALGQMSVEGGQHVNAVSFGPDGRVLVGGISDGTLRLWDVTDRAEPRQHGEPVEGHENSVHRVSHAPDGRYFASAGGDRAVYVWDPTGPVVVAGVSPPAGASANAVAFARDGRTLAVGDTDHLVTLWDITVPGQPRVLGRALAGHAGAVNTVEFGSDGRTVTSGGDDGAVRVWDVSGLTGARDDPVQRVCAILGRGLTPDEWADLIPGVPFQETCPAQVSGPVR